MTPRQKKRLLMESLKESIWSMSEWAKDESRDHSPTPQEKAWAERRAAQYQEILDEMEGEDDA